MAICDIDGQHSYDPEELSKRVRAMLGKMTTVGGAMIAFAAAIQVPWMIYLSSFSSGLAFTAIATR